MFEQWLKADPQWGWGWIGWSDCYGLFATAGNNDFSKAEALLKQGLDVKDVRDRDYIIDRLTQTYEEQGRHQEGIAGSGTKPCGVEAQLRSSCSQDQVQG